MRLTWLSTVFESERKKKERKKERKKEGKRKKKEGTLCKRSREVVIIYENVLFIVSQKIHLCYCYRYVYIHRIVYVHFYSMFKKATLTLTLNQLVAHKTLNR